MLHPTLDPRFRLLHSLIHVASQVLLDSSKTIAEVVNMGVELVHSFNSFPSSVVEVAHTLLELGLDPVGQFGNDFREPLIKKYTLSYFLSVRVCFG